MYDLLSASICVCCQVVHHDLVAHVLKVLVHPAESLVELSSDPLNLQVHRLLAIAETDESLLMVDIC